MRPTISAATFLIITFLRNGYSSDIDDNDINQNSEDFSLEESRNPFLWNYPGNYHSQNFNEVYDGLQPEIELNFTDPNLTNLMDKLKELSWYDWINRRNDYEKEWHGNDNSLEQFNINFNQNNFNSKLKSPYHEIKDSKRSNVSFSYEDQNSWRDKFPKCGGSFQSPINLRSKYTIPVKTSTCLRWVGYKSIRKDLHVKLQEKTVEAWASWEDGVSYDAEERNHPKVSGGPLREEYFLYRIHFHWGFDNTDGSEHPINSRKYALESHFVHISSVYKNITEAINSGDPEALVVVSVIYKVGDTSDLGMTAVVNAIKKNIINNDPIENDYLPLFNFGLDFRGDYYTYLGSVTTPGCHQVVRWIVSNRINSINHQHLEVFRSLKKKDGNLLLDNFRQPQQLNGRRIHYYNPC